MAILRGFPPSNTISPGTYIRDGDNAYHVDGCVCKSRQVPPPWEGKGLSVTEKAILKWETQQEFAKHH
jgi:hypothetical protein